MAGNPKLFVGYFVNSGDEDRTIVKTKGWPFHRENPASIK
jgi:hypothetical protein